ncbi:hypothetical protein DL768_006482 [Monosporascus sp. mg162]|nr:hypothetical protein DL768_006482 [Monosporascus sp. mg162]
MEEPSITEELETVTVRILEVGAQNQEGHERATSRPPSEIRGVKRPAEDEDMDNARGEGDGGDAETMTETPAALSKNQQKKLKRQKRWEEKKLHMKEKRKEKRHDRKERKKLEREAEIAAAAEGREPALGQPPKRDPGKRAQVPVSVIIDCQFEKYMMEKELVSLCSQVTRCYSENKNSQFPVHLFVSSYSGAMKTRYETALANQHQNWKGIHFREGDFMEVAKEAKELMASPRGGKTIELLERGRDASLSFVVPVQDGKRPKKSTPVVETEAEDVDRSVVYLTADSPYTLNCLEPNTCYVIGGIIDKNREKGLCYKIARERNVRTAKLPIGEFMVMQSRHILATNHVMDIILKYLELGNWADAFMRVIPTRKGGKLKEDDDATTEADQAEGRDENNVENGGTGAGAEQREQEDEEIVDRDAAQGSRAPVGTAESEGLDAQQPEVEGANADEGLQKNVLGQKEWSAPPVEREEIRDPVGTAEGSREADPTSHPAHLSIIWLPVIEGMCVEVSGSITSGSSKKFPFAVATSMLLPDIITFDTTGSVSTRSRTRQGCSTCTGPRSFFNVPLISGEHLKPTRNDEMIDSVKQSRLGTPLCLVSADKYPLATMGVSA